MGGGKATKCNLWVKEKRTLPAMGESRKVKDAWARTTVKFALSHALLAMSPGNLAGATDNYLLQ